jgi:tRNA pseudouridine(54/55) synthase
MPTPSETAQATASQESGDAGGDPQPKSDASLERIAALPPSAQLPAGKWQPGVNYDPVVPAQPTSVSSGKVEVLGLERCRREAVARLKGLRPEKSYRALVRLATDVDDAHLSRLADLVGLLRQETPVRVLKRRPDLVRDRRILSLQWKRIDPRTLELAVRTQAGTYIKELISGDGGRTQPSVSGILGIPAECAELDVTAIHI